MIFMTISLLFTISLWGCRVCKRNSAYFMLFWYSRGHRWLQWKCNLCFICVFLSSKQIKLKSQCRIQILLRVRVSSLTHRVLNLNYDLILKWHTTSTQTQSLIASLKVLWDAIYLFIKRSEEKIKQNQAWGLCSPDTIGLIFFHGTLHSAHQQAERNVNRPLQAHQTAVHFSFIIDRESKKPPFQLGASYTLPSAAPTSLSGCLSSYLLERDSKFSFFCSLASLFDLRNSANEAGPLAGSWRTLRRQRHWDVPRDLSHPHRATSSDSAAQSEQWQSSTCNYLPLEIQHNLK